MKNFILIAILILGSIVYGQVDDLSYASMARERFFYNETENIVNSQNIYYDENGRIVMTAFLNENETERARKIYKYDDFDRIVEFSIWDRTGTGWNRWWHSLTEVNQVDNLIVYTEYTKRYNERPVLTLITKYNAESNLMYQAEYGYDGSINIREYNENGELVYEEYENEKTDGKVFRYYVYSYFENKPSRCQILNEEQNLVQEIEYIYEGDLLAKQLSPGIAGGSGQAIYFYYENGSLIRQDWIDPVTEKPVFTMYYEYDSQGRLIKKGEKTDLYERYWSYEYYERGK